MISLQLFLEDSVNMGGVDIVDIVKPIDPMSTNADYDPSSHQTRIKPEEVDTPRKKCNTIFTVIKPGFLDKAQDIIDKFEKNGWRILKTRSKKLTLGEAKQLYISHKKEDFYEDLCNYMASDVTMAIIYQKRGCKDVFEESGKIKDEIRKEWGKSDMRNVMHSSDSFSNMEVESSIYF